MKVETNYWTVMELTLRIAVCVVLVAGFFPLYIAVTVTYFCFFVGASILYPLAYVVTFGHYYHVYRFILHTLADVCAFGDERFVPFLNWVFYAGETKFFYIEGTPENGQRVTWTIKDKVRARNREAALRKFVEKNDGIEFQSLKSAEVS